MNKGLDLLLKTTENASMKLPNPTRIRPVLVWVAILVFLVLAGTTTVLRDPTEKDVTKARERGEYITLKEMQYAQKVMNFSCTQCHALPKARAGLNRDWPNVLSRMAKKAKIDSTNTWRIRVYMEVLGQDSIRAVHKIDTVP